MEKTQLQIDQLSYLKIKKAYNKEVKRIEQEQRTILVNKLRDLRTKLTRAKAHFSDLGVDTDVVDKALQSVDREVSEEKIKSEKREQERVRKQRYRMSQKEMGQKD